MLRKSTGCSSKVEIFKSLLSSSGRVKLLQVYTIQPCASGILKACASLKINKYKFAAQTITKTDQMTFLSSEIWWNRWTLPIYKNIWGWGGTVILNFECINWCHIYSLPVPQVTTPYSIYSLTFPPESLRFKLAWNAQKHDLASRPRAGVFKEKVNY